MIAIVDLRCDPHSPRLAAIAARHAELDPRIDEKVAGIVEAVRREGDTAVRRFTASFDQIDRHELRADRREIEDLAAQVPRELRLALASAAAHIRDFHERQRPRTLRYERERGVTLGLRVDPLASVGLYVPGGKAAYPSTVLMNAIPAQVAGVERIVAVTPPGTFRRSPVVAGVLDLLGIDEVYLVGGAQAIAALAFGTESIPRVAKIVGPGNAFVASAKRRVFGQVAIDSIAGPTEIVVVADSEANPAWIAADLLSQAEHDEQASAIAVVWDGELAQRIATEIQDQLATLDRRAIAEKSLVSYGAIVVVESEGKAVELANELAPEHLEIMTRDPEAFARRVRNAGALFLGPFSAEVVGDYVAGANHVLPTNGTARFSSPLGTEDFVKRTSVISYDEAALRRDLPAILAIAQAEGLGAHAAAARIRAESPATGATAPASSVDPLSVVKPEVRALPPYTLAPLRAPVKLNQNENPHDLPASLKEEIVARLGDRSWNRYPDFVPTSLLERVAAHARWRPDGVLAGNGSNELISALLAVTVGPGVQVATFDPTFSLYGLLVGIQGGTLHKIALGPDMDFAMPALLEAARTCDLLILCSPNNPTGRQLPESGLVEVLEAARGVVALDEAYVEFASRNMGHLLGRHRHLVVLRTFSKALSMAGLRVGYLLGDPALCREIDKAKLPYNLNAFSLIAAEVALERYDLLEPAIEAIVRERGRVLAALGTIDGVEALPTDANFVLVRTRVSPRAIFEGLLDRGILVRDVSSHPRLADCLRFNIGTAQENDRFLSALPEVLAAQASGR